MVIEKGKKVTFHYTVSVDNEVIQTSEGQQPMSYTHGTEQIIPGLADEVEGMKEGEQKSVTVAAENAYGKVDPNAFRELPKSSLPERLEPRKDMKLQMRTPEGQTIPVRVSEVRPQSIIIDMNHPLAGKDLKFDVKVVSVE
jgi:FKBP-type peptidyl-prolyl cis-trans isomerase 2